MDEGGATNPTARSSVRRDPVGRPATAPRAGGNAAVPTPDERTWAMVSHLVGLLGPIAVLLTKGKGSAYVRQQAVEALNFQATVLIALAVAIALRFVFLGVFTLIATAIAGVVLAAMAAFATHQGAPFRYPVALRLIQ